MEQKEIVGGIIMVAAVLLVIKLAGLVMRIFSGAFWIIALGIAIYAFINPTFRNGLFSAFRYVYNRVFGK
jgi:hypothetical protein